MNPDITMMLDIAAELELLGMKRLPKKIAELANNLDRALSDAKNEAIAECAAICSGFANDFSELQIEGLYAAGRYDQAMACNNNIRKLLRKEIVCLPLA